MQILLLQEKKMAVYKGYSMMYILQLRKLYIFDCFSISYMIKTITFPLSDNLHMRFKQYCIDRDISMKDALVLAVQLIINKKK